MLLVLMLSNIMLVCDILSPYNDEWLVLIVWLITDFYNAEVQAFDKVVTDWERMRYFERI